MTEIQIKLKNPHPAQKEILNNRKRFNVLKCGRRFGKTEIFQELASESIEQGHIFAYFSPTYKDLYEVWHEIQRVFYGIIESKSETVKQLIFTGGAKVDFWSMEDPDSGRGRKYHRVVVDECEKAGKFQQAWEESIRATLTDFKGDAYLISTPKFGDTYFKKICHNEKQFADWKTFIFTSYDNPYIDREELDEARRLLGDAVFDCEYMAKDLDGKSVNPFAFQFTESKHICDPLPFNPNKQLYISVDFNLNPFCVGFSHIWRDTLIHWHVIDEVSIPNGSIQSMVEAIKLRYAAQISNCRLTGDHMGVNGQLGERDNASFYTQLKRGLNLRDAQVITPANPTHENSRADVNYFLYHSSKDNPDFDFKVYSNCKGVIRDLKTVQCDAFGEIKKKDRKDLAQQADLLDGAIRYTCNTFLKSFILEHQKIQGKSKNKFIFTPELPQHFKDLLKPQF
jgi:hypothetical protein